MKKIGKILLGAVVIGAMLLALTACYVSKPATMSDLVGTYELKTYTYKSDSAPQEQEADNRIALRGITAYLIVKSNGTGYYVYRSNDVALSAVSVKIDYTYDDKDSNKIKQIHYDTGLNSSGGLPGSGRETLGLTFEKKSKRLNYNQPSLGKLHPYATSVSYEKVSDSDDLSYVNKKLKTSLDTPLEYSLNGLMGTYALSRDSDEYAYMFYDLDIVNKKVTRYYATKEDPLDGKTEVGDLTYEYPADDATVLLITFFGITYRKSLTFPMSPSFEYTPLDENGNIDYINQFYCYRDGRTPEEIIAEKLYPYTHTEEEQAPETEPAEETPSENSENSETVEE